MGKWTNERRKLLFAELKESGQLDVPFFPKGKPKPQLQPKPKPIELTIEQRGCCLYKYGTNMPKHFRRCPGCTVE